MARKEKAEGHRSSASMRKFLLLMMTGLVTITMGSLVGLLLAMKLIPSLNDTAYRSMYNQSVAQASRVGVVMNNITRSVLRSSTTLEAALDKELAEYGLRYDQLSGNTEAMDAYLTTVYAELRDLLREQSVSGAFVILDSEYEHNDVDGHVSMYVRNTMSSSSYFSNSTLTLMRGPVRITNQTLPLALDKNWTYGHELEPGADEFYVKPMAAARTYTRASAEDLGYWSTRFRLEPTDTEIITYTVPMVGEYGDVYGVCGIEMSLANIARITPSGDLPFQNGYYLFGHFVGGEMVKESMVSNDLDGDIFLGGMWENTRLTSVNNSSAYDVYSVEDEYADTLAAVVSIGLYSGNSPYKTEDYFLYVLAPREQVLEHSHAMTQDILIMLVAAALLSVIGAITLSSYFGKRIEKLAKAAGNLNPERPVTLPRTKILELDLLSDVLERMNADVAAHAARMSTIVDSVGMPMGAFEVLLAKDLVFLTDSLFRLLDIPHNEEDSQYISAKQFQEYLPQVYAPLEQGESIDFSWMPKEGVVNPEEARRWFRLRRTFHDDFLSGTLLDITEEVKEKEQLEYERNYDPLTKLLNRNAYHEMMTCLMTQMPNKMGVFLFGDLDNLKTVNDTFGHDTGDRYIQMAADALSLFSREGGVVARISGDEFAVYLHGGDSREELRHRVTGILQRVREHKLTLPDGNIQKMRISVGLAYYPDDADNIVDLMKYADFAMYEIKHSAKGGTHEFNRDSYERNSYILNKPSQLDLLLDESRTRFAFQPIVETTTGQIAGYEVLMRPQTRELHTPGQVITLAKSQSKLPQLERLTFFSMMDWVKEHTGELGESMLFFNSLPSQLLSDEDYEKFNEMIRDYDCQLVMEITEEEQSSPEKLQKKVKIAREANVKIALDDFGSGYSNFINLLNIQPDYIKIDMTIIRGIDDDVNRQALLKSILEYAKDHDMQTIAEGVETYEELRMVVSLGVHFIQGFYICHPEFRLVKELPDRVRKEIVELSTL